MAFAPKTNEPVLCMGIDIGDKNFGYAIARLAPDRKIRLLRIGTKDFKDDTVKDTGDAMILGFHDLIQDFIGQKLTVGIELQGKTVAKNRIYQHILCAYLTTRTIFEKDDAKKWVPESRFVEPRDKFRVSAEEGKMKLLTRSEVEIIKTHGNRKKEAIRRAKQLMPLLLERPEEALRVQEGMNDHMADALLTSLYVLMRTGDKTSQKRKRTSFSGHPEKKQKTLSKEHAQWSF